MVQVRKLVLAIAAASALTSGMAHALGLGEIALKSALNQPLDAEIELLEVKDLGSSDVMPALAAVEEFSRVGIDRPNFLSDLKFTPVIKANGKSVIRITSTKPVREPYVNFLVEVVWPSGRLLREYTVLLDPPLYSPQAAEAVMPPVAPAPVRSAAPLPPPMPAPVVSRPSAPPAPSAPAVSAPKPAPVARPAPVVSRPAAPAPAVRTPAPAVRQDAESYRVEKNDTLWEIASSVRPGNSVSIHQTMLAIQALNPNAFLDGNINRLKKGAVLRLPDEAQIRKRSRAEALAEVQSQNEVWRQGRAAPVAASGARQVDATRRSEAGNAPSTVPAGDTLKLVSAASGKAASGSDKGGAGKSAGLSDKLAVAEETLATTTRENQELKDRLSDLQSQLDKLQRIVDLKNAQLAKMTADVQAQPAPAKPVDAVKPVDAAVKPVEVAKPAVVKPAETAAPAVPAVPVTPAVPADAARGVAPAAPTAPAQVPVEAAKPVKPVEPKPAEAKPKPAKPAEPKPEPVYYEPSLLDDVMGDPMLLAAGGGGLAVLLGLGLMFNARRKALKAAAEEAQYEDTDDDSVAQGAVGSTEVLAAVEELIAYGRYEEASSLLNEAIELDAQNAELRLKLMEVCAEMGDKGGFLQQEEALDRIGGCQAQIDQMRARYPQLLAEPAVRPEAAPARVSPAVAVAAVAGAAAVVAAPAAAQAMTAVPPVIDTVADDDDLLSLDDLSLDDPAVPSDVSAMQDDDGLGANELSLPDDEDLSLDDLEAEFERDLAAGAAGTDDDLMSLDDLDAMGSLEEPAPIPAASPAISSDDDLAFDLDDLGLDDIAAPAAPAAAPAAADLDDDLGFDLDDLGLDDIAEPAAPAAAPAATQDDDLGFDLDAALGELDDLDDVPAAPAETPAPASAVSDDDDDLMGLLGGDVPDLGAGSDDDLLADLENFGDFGLDLNEPAAAPAAQIGASAEDDLLPSLDDLEMEMQSLSGAQADTDDDLSLDGLDLPDLDAAADLLAAPQAAVSAPAAMSADDDLLAEFGDLGMFDDEPAAGTKPAGGEDFDLMSSAGDEAGTMLELARAYIDMGDGEGAREILEEVLHSGTPEQQKAARELLGDV